MPSVNVTKLSHFSGHKDAIYALCRAAGRDKFYSGGGDGLVVEWDHRNKGDGQVLVKVNRPVYSLCLHMEAGFLFCGAASGNLYAIDLEQGREVRNIEAHTLGIFDMKIANGQLITAGGDGCICVWELPSLRLLYRLQASEKSVRSLSVSENRLAAGFSDHQVRIYELPGFELRRTIDAHRNSVFAVAFTPDGKELLSGGRDAVLRSWLVHEQYNMELDIAAHTLHINAISFNPSGDLFATVSMDKTIKIWATGRMQLLKVIDRVRNGGHSHSVNKALWLEDDLLLTGGDDRNIMLWQIGREV